MGVCPPVNPSRERKMFRKLVLSIRGIREQRGLGTAIWVCICNHVYRISSVLYPPSHPTLQLYYEGKYIYFKGNYFCLILLIRPKCKIAYVEMLQRT